MTEGRHDPISLNEHSIYCTCTNTVCPAAIFVFAGHRNFELWILFWLEHVQKDLKLLIWYVENVCLTGNRRCEHSWAISSYYRQASGSTINQKIIEPKLLIFKRSPHSELEKSFLNMTMDKTWMWSAAWLVRGKVVYSDKQNILARFLSMISHFWKCI